MTTATSPSPATLLQGARIVDGSGAPAWEGDLLLQGDRILALGPDLLRALPAGVDRSSLATVDCRGLVAAPGFIDAHTHDDALVLRQPDCIPKLTQGITTVITGNCGISLAPYQTAQAPPPLNLLGADNFRHADMAGYRAAVAVAQPAVNVVALVGHTTLRFAAMQDLERPANATELLHMCALLEASLAAGAHGLSSGMFYAPAMAAPAEEVIALAKVVARYGGVYATHLRSEMETIIEALHEAGDTAFAAGVPLVLSHHKCAGPANWGRTLQTLPLIEGLAQRQEVGMDAYPYLAGSTVLREDLVDGVIDILVTWSDSHPEMEGRMLADVARDWGTNQQEACRRLQPGGACYFQMRQDDVDRVITHPLTMIGSDGLPHDRHPHPRLWGAFPRVLGHYWRERQLLSLEDAVHKMTGMTARRMRIADRGLLQAGLAADVVLFDPKTVGDLATFDAPTRRSRGIARVYVNGVCSYEAPEREDMPVKVQARAGRMLRRG